MYLDFILVPNNGRFRLKSINIFSTFSTVVSNSKEAFPPQVVLKI